MIDWARVSSLRAEIGDEGFDEVVELFLDEVESVIARLRSSPEPLHFEQDLHFLKGGAWNLGFVDFGAICQEGERQAAHGEAAAVDIGAVIEIYVRSRAAFMAGLASEAGRSSVA